MIGPYITKHANYEAAYFWFGPLFFRVWKSEWQPKHQFSIEIKVFINFRRVLRWPK